jgi:hypothetical protein
MEEHLFSAGGIPATACEEIKPFVLEPLPRPKTMGAGVSPWPRLLHCHLCFIAETEGVRLAFKLVPV